MARQLRYHPVISQEVVRKIYHEAGIRYRDWTPALVVIFATKAKLKALKLTQATQRHRQSLTDQLRRLEQKKAQLTEKLYTLTHPQTDFTPLGQKLLNNPKSESRRSLQEDRIQTQIEEIDHQIQTIQEQQKNETLLLSGEVAVRGN